MRRNTTQSKSALTAFTLVETLTVIAISSFILVGLTRAIIFFYDTNEYAVQQSAAIRSASGGVERLVKDVREASYADTGAFPVANFSTSSITVYADVNRDQQVERVHYELINLDFVRAVTSPSGSPPDYTGGDTTTSTLSDNVRNQSEGVPIFTYYDINGNRLSQSDSRQDLAFVSIELIVNVDPDRTPDNTTIKSSATLRNINKPS
jgi:type II secretory pathway pseudopilin PulG